MKIKERFETKWKAQKWPWIDVKMGVNTANVFVGNLGAPDRMKYGVLGDGVNMAARLQMLNRRYNTKVMVSQAVMDVDEVSQVSCPRPLLPRAFSNRRLVRRLPPLPAPIC